MLNIPESCMCFANGCGSFPSTSRQFQELDFKLGSHGSLFHTGETPDGSTGIVTGFICIPLHVSPLIAIKMAKRMFNLQFSIQSFTTISSSCLMNPYFVVVILIFSNHRNDNLETTRSSCSEEFCKSVMGGIAQLRTSTYLSHYPPG